MQKWITVNDMWKYASDNNLKLLSTFGGDFWSEYTNNNQVYDLLFKRLYKSFRYFDQDITDENLNVENVTTEFIAQVNAHLLVNRKKYEELFRVHALSDSAYDLFNNINITESKTGSTSNANTNIYGARTDSTNTTLGQRQDTSEDQVSAFNSTSYTNANKTIDVKGSETDSVSFSKGAETDTTSSTGSNTENRTKTGKLNMKSNAELLQEHMDVWDVYEFYTYIFSDIASNLLLI